tara:strand:- start:26 stop:232 length:207 start_codon:yes stop_codon:yes gene_type:complete
MAKYGQNEHLMCYTHLSAEDLVERLSIAALIGPVLVLFFSTWIFPRENDTPGRMRIMAMAIIVRAELG